MSNATDPATNVYTVILAGGVGARFWPLSRAARPKQLLDPFGEGSMLRMTVRRIAPLCPAERCLIVTGRSLGDAIQAELPELPPDNFLEEPCGRNTAPAIGWACRHLRDRDPDAVVAILPADHFVADEDAFRRDVQAALELARGGAIATLGIQPTRPETGFGYIQAGGPDDPPHAVRAFREKPDAATALSWLREGGYYWNGGMFFARAAVLLAELERLEPELGAGLARYVEGGAADDTIWRDLRSISIDYAVMEHTPLARVVPTACGWSDVGSWTALLEHRGQAASFHEGEVLEIDGAGNVLLAEGGLVAAVGVEGLAVVHTPDATLVCPLAEAQRVREVVDALKATGRGELT